MGVLDRGRDPAQGAGDGALVGGLAGVQPGPQVALLGAGQPGDGGAVVGVLLDQGQRLEHRVVQVRGDVGALLGADPLGPLVAQVGGEPVDPRPDHDARPTMVSSAAIVTSRAISSEPPRRAKTTKRGDDQADARPRPGRTPPSRRCRTRPAPGRSGRWCPASARAAPRRPGATAARRRRCPSTTGQNTVPRPSTASSSRIDAEAERGQRDRRTDVAEPADPARAAAAAGRALQARARPSRSASRSAAPATGRRTSTMPKPPRTAATHERRPAPRARAARGAGPGRPATPPRIGSWVSR